MKSTTRTAWTVMMMVGAVVLSILGGVIGSVTNKTECERCATKADTGWLGFSITWFITSIGIIIWLMIQSSKGGRAFSTM